MNPLLNELQDRAMAGDVNAQQDLETLLSQQSKVFVWKELAVEYAAINPPTVVEYDHSKRPCTCGSGHTWMNCTGLPNGDTSWCG